MNQTSMPRIYQQGYEQCGATQPMGADRQTQIESQTQRLETLGNDLTAIVETLQKRLSCVVQPRAEKLSNDPAVPREVLVPLAENLRLSGDRFERNLHQLRELNASIELP